MVARWLHAPLVVTAITATPHASNMDTLEPIGIVVLAEDGTPMVRWNAGLDLGMELYAIKPNLIAWHTELDTDNGVYRELSYEQKPDFKPLYELE